MVAFLTDTHMQPSDTLHVCFPTTVLCSGARRTLQHIRKLWMVGIVRLDGGLYR